MANKKKVNVLLDTNFLIDVARFRIDIDDIKDLVDGSCELIVVYPVMRELKNIAASKKRSSMYAKVALKLVEMKKIKRLSIKNSMPADDAIICIACKSKGNIAVATNDAYLKKRLKGKKIKTIYLRSKKHLASGR